VSAATVPSAGTVSVALFPLTGFVSNEVVILLGAPSAASVTSPVKFVRAMEMSVVRCPPCSAET